MMRYMGLVASLLFSPVLSSDIMEAVFDLNSSYVQGKVTIQDGQIAVDLNISELLAAGALPNGCIINETEGILYHLHTHWGHTDIQSGYLSDCNATFTGGHYDPYGACGSSSGYSYCSVNGGCISSSTYTCSSSAYSANEYACEVGDWSGKYGRFIYMGNGTVSADVQSFGEITGNQLMGKSIVFHCSNNKARAFCASFQNASGTITGSSRRQSNGYKLKADFSSALSLSSGQQAYFSMNYDGQVEAKFSQNALNGLTCSGGSVKAWIGDAWNDNSHVSLKGSSCTAAIYGMAHDPTNQCYSNDSNSDNCENGKLCGVNDYTYSCNYGTDPFSCSPMDLSGRYGSINIAANSGADTTISVFDRYMADLTNLVHKSVILTCASDAQPLLCAKLQNVAVGTAVATFTNSTAGAEGTVTVTDGQVTIDVSFAYAAKYYLNNTLPAACFSSGLKAHIHEIWNYGDNNARIGPTACGKSFTGGHWDPWAACSTTTGYTSVCSIPPTPSPTACVAVGGSAGNNTYACNADSYKQNPFLCEVGDWSSKYGTYQFTNGFNVQRSDHSPWEVDASELVGRSIVFHCGNDASRAFCAPFLLENNVHDGQDAQPTWPLSTQTGNTIGKAIVYLKGDEGSITLQSDGYYNVDLNISKDENCSSTIAYAVFKDGTCTSVYDPTVQCPPITEYDGTLCSSQETCGVTAYNCDWINYPYSCAPSDLSGKYGITSSQKTRMASGWDDLMIPLSHLQGRYLGLYCTDTWEIIECQPWTFVVATTTTEPATTTTESIGHQQTYSVGLGLALLIVMSFLY